MVLDLPLPYHIPCISAWDLNTLETGNYTVSFSDSEIRIVRGSLLSGRGWLDEGGLLSQSVRLKPSR